MSVDSLIDSWKEARGGLIEEASLIPAEQFLFRATPNTRSVAEILQHIVETQKVFVGETCRPDTNLMRRSIPEQIAAYAPEVSTIEGKNGLVELLRSSMEIAEATIRSFEDNLGESMQRFDGRTMSKSAFLSFGISHEMYHRGQVTVYQRLLNIEPALTRRFKKLFATTR